MKPTFTMSDESLEVLRSLLYFLNIILMLRCQDKFDFWPVYFAVWLFLSKCSIGCFIETHSHNQWLIIESFKIVARFFKLNFNVEVWLQIWFFLTSILVYFAVWLFLSKCSIGCFMETHSHNQQLIIGSFKIVAQFLKHNFDVEVS